VFAEEERMLGESPFDRRWKITFIALGAYAVTQALSVWAETRLPSGSPLAIIAVLAPIVPFGWAVRKWVDVIRRGDEMNRRIQLEALSLSLPATLFMVMALPLLAR